jgi:hypothetical protein
MAVANDLTMAARILNDPVRMDPLGDFAFDGLAQQPLSAVAQNARQHVLGAYGWQRNDRIATLSHGGVLGSVQQAATNLPGGNLTKHRWQHRVESLSPKALGQWEFEQILPPTSEPKVAGSSPAGCTSASQR